MATGTEFGLGKSYFFQRSVETSHCCCDEDVIVSP